MDRKNLTTFHFWFLSTFIYSGLLAFIALTELSCQIQSRNSNRAKSSTMVLLPKPPEPKEAIDNPLRNVFFENDELDYMAKHYVGNNIRFVSILL